MQNKQLTNTLIKQNIQRIAAEQDITLEELSVKIGKTKSYISSAFSKNKKLISLEILKSIAKALGTTVCEILGGL
jgi:transcriptional regulator with XRE-family HTH domain